MVMFLESFQKVKNTIKKKMEKFILSKFFEQINEIRTNIY